MRPLMILAATVAGLARYMDAWLDPIRPGKFRLVLLIQVSPGAMIPSWRPGMRRSQAWLWLPLHSLNPVCILFHTGKHDLRRCRNHHQPAVWGYVPPLHDPGRNRDILLPSSCAASYVSLVQLYLPSAITWDSVSTLSTLCGHAS